MTCQDEITCSVMPAAFVTKVSVLLIRPVGVGAGVGTAGVVDGISLFQFFFKSGQGSPGDLRTMSDAIGIIGADFKQVPREGIPLIAALRAVPVQGGSWVMLLVPNLG